MFRDQKYVEWMLYSVMADTDHIKRTKISVMTLKKYE